MRELIQLPVLMVVRGKPGGMPLQEAESSAVLCAGSVSSGGFHIFCRTCHAAADHAWHILTVKMRGVWYK